MAGPLLPPLPPGGHLIVRPVKSDVNTVVFYKGKVWTVKVNLPKSAEKTYSFGANRESKIQELALSILAEKFNVSSTVQDTTSIHAKFSLEDNNTHVKGSTLTSLTHTTSGKTENISLESDKTSALAQKILGIISRALPSHQEVPLQVRSKPYEEFEGRFYEIGPLQAAKEAVKADNSNIDENSLEFKQALHNQLVANPIRTLSPAEPDELKAMLASGKNTYFTATITALLACDQLSTYLASSLDAIAFNPVIANPTTWGLDHQPPSIEHDYRKWKISNVEDRKDTFIRMSSQQAAETALGLINDYKDSKKELTENQSQILKMCLLKLCNIQRSEELEEGKKIPHVDNSDEISIEISKPGEPYKFLNQLLAGLDELADNIEIPFKTIDEGDDVCSYTTELDVIAKDEDPECGALDSEKLRSIAGKIKDCRYISLKINPEGFRKVDLSELQALNEDFTLDTVVFKQISGSDERYFTLKFGDDFISVYDSSQNPSTLKEESASEQGEFKNYLFGRVENCIPVLVNLKRNPNDEGSSDRSSRSSSSGSVSSEEESDSDED